MNEKKNGSHVFASSLTASNAKRVNLTWLSLEIMHCGHTWHDYPWPWVSLTWLLWWSAARWRHRHWFRKFTARFRPITKETVSSMYNNGIEWSSIRSAIIRVIVSGEKEVWLCWCGRQYFPCYNIGIKQIPSHCRVDRFWSSSLCKK